jgi:moderate conductance mechanosensitive channel
MHPSVITARFGVFFISTARFGIFKEGRFLGRVLDEWINDAQEFIRTKLPHLIVVALIAFILTRVLQIVTNHIVRIAEHHSASPSRMGQVKTLSGVIRATGFTCIGVIAGLQFLEALGVNLAPLLASAGVAGIAIGLAAQTTVKDMLNGVLILVEDQFNVGDVVRLAGLSGVVETMTLRKTTVRDGDGTLYVIPNSQITTVANQSVGFSVATVNVSVDFSADPDEVVKLLKSIAMDIRTSDEFKQVFIEDPQILGVDNMKGSEMIFPVVFKTLAQKQYGALREFRRRVRLALEKNHMLPGDPNRIFNTFVADGAPPRPNMQRAEESAAHAPDPTTLKPHETNPFTGE